MSRRATRRSRPSPTCVRFSATRPTNHWPAPAEAMTNAAMATYAFEQIELARATSRSAAMNGAHSGVVTFLFTDIEGSTRRWEADADAMRAALAAHDELLVRPSKCTMAGCSTTPVTGCVPRSHPRRSPSMPRWPRSGPGTAGADGHRHRRGRIARRRLLRHGAQSGRAGDGGRPRRSDPARWRDCGSAQRVDLIRLGPRRLRDIAKPVDVFQVRAPGLRTEFPPLKTLDSTPGNLRPPTRALLGRESAARRAGDGAEGAPVGDTDRCRRGRQDPAGVGGGRAVGTEFPDGVWVIELAPVGDPAAVPEAVAAVLGITQQPGMTLADSVAAALEGRSRLLVFDNCEHVLDATADMIEVILAHSATVKILATSREGLRVSDEQLWPVPSLDVRTGSTPPRRHCSSSGPKLSRRVFVDRHTPSWRSAADSTVSRWRSSWPRPAWCR